MKLNRIDAGPVNVGYVDAGPADRPAALLLHGWPYDTHIGRNVPQEAPEAFADAVLEVAQ